MIWTWIYLTYVLVFISGTTADAITIQIMDDFTFILVHNLSDVKDWSNFFSQLPYLQSQLMFGQQPQVEGGGGGGNLTNITTIEQFQSMGQTQEPTTESDTFQRPPVQKPTVIQLQKPPLTEKPPEPEPEPEPVENPEQVPPTPVDYENPDMEEVTQKPTPVQPMVPQKPVPMQQPIPPKPVPMQQPIPPNPISMQQPIPMKPVSMQQPISPKPVPMQQPIPPKPVSMQQPIPPKPIPMQEPMPPKPVPMQQPIPPKPIPTQQPIPPKPVPTQQPIPPKPVPTQQPIPPKPVPTQQPIPQRPNQQRIPPKPTSIYHTQKPPTTQSPMAVRPTIPQKPGSNQPQKPQKPATQEIGGGSVYQTKIPPDMLEPESESAAMEKPNEQPPLDSDSCGMRGVPNPSRIVGGSDAQPAEFPWQLSLQLMSGPRARHICGAAVLSAHWAITAAHCIWEIKPEQLSVVAGDHDLYVAEGHEQRVNVARIVVNKYKRDTFTNDVAMLQMVTPLNVDYKYITPICLPEATMRFLRGDSVVAGWGRLSENGALPHVLQHVSLPILSLKRCHSLYRKAGYTKFIHTCQLCSGFELGAYDSCQGDSGGPLVCKQSDGRYYLCGIVSWGVGCARPKFPGVYTEVTCFVEWIKHIINNDGNVLNKAPSIVSIPSNTRAWRGKATKKGKGKPNLELLEEEEEEEQGEDEGSKDILRRTFFS